MSFEFDGYLWQDNGLKDNIINAEFKLKLREF